MSDVELSDQYEDEIEQPEEDAQKTGSKSPSKLKHEKHQEDEYRLQRALKPPRATTYTAQALYDQIHSGDVDLYPEYQRDVVWTKEKQTGLIDSILRNFYIPPIIFAVNSYDDGSETKTCIDGKQRLTSIYRFMDGFIPHRDPITNEKLWFKIDPEVHGNKRGPAVRLLPEKYRRAFANKQIVCVEYQGLTDSDERDIFQRVQLGMALTSAEKLHVISTPRAHFIRSLLDSHVSVTTLGDPNFPWDRTRGSDFRCISQAVFVMSKWTTSPLSGAGTLPQVEKWLTETGESHAKGKAAAKKKPVGRPRKHSKDKKGKGKEEDVDIDEDDEEDQIDDDGDYIDAPEVPEAFAKKVKETYDIFVALTRDKKLNKAFFNWPKVSPIEIICVAILIFVHGVHAKPDDRLTLQELASVIYNMRVLVRLEHKDIRMNDRIGKFMIEYIRRVNKSDIPSDPSKSSLLTKKHTSGVASISASSAKRKRQSEPGDDDDEYTGCSSSTSRAKPAPKKKHVAPKKTQQSTPAPSTSSDPIVKGKRKDNLAAIRDARGSISTPMNPQQLPSPEVESTQHASGSGFELAGSLLSNPNSVSNPNEVKTEHSKTPPYPGAGPAVGDMYPGGMIGLQNMPPAMRDSVLAFYSMGYAGGMPPMSQISQVPMMPSQIGQGMHPGMGPQMSQMQMPMDAPISVSQMQQWMQSQPGQSK